jgi:hypothetical protein
MATTSGVMSVMLAALFAVLGAAKLLQWRWELADPSRLGYSVRAYRIVGALELAGAAGLVAGLFWRPLGVAAAFALVLLLIGAVVSHLRAGDGMKQIAPAVWVGAVAAATGVIAGMAM